MHGEVFKGGLRNSATFKTELDRQLSLIKKLQRASSYGHTTNGKYLHVTVVTRPSLQRKIKIG